MTRKRASKTDDQLMDEFLMKAFAKLAGLIFPAFNELQYVMALTAVIAGATLPRLNGHDTIAIGTYWIAASYFATMVVLGIYVMKREVLSPLVKLGLVLPYYIFFFVLAFYAMGHLPPASSIHGLFQHINYWLIQALLYLPLIRILIILLSFRFGAALPLILAIGNFKDTQYKLVGFASGIGLTVVSVLIIKHFYHDPAAVVLLGFSYANFVYLAVRGYTDHFLAFPRQYRKRHPDEKHE
jgi:hypothetical protein